MNTHKSRKVCCTNSYYLTTHLNFILASIIASCVIQCQGFLFLHIPIPSRNVRIRNPSTADQQINTRLTHLHITQFRYDNGRNSNSTILNGYGGGKNFNRNTKGIADYTFSDNNNINNGIGKNKAHKNGIDLPYLRVTEASSQKSPQDSRERPFPIMPSQTFFDLANSQFELLSNSIRFDPIASPFFIERERSSKIKSIALYMPQENPQTGHLEFMPSLVYPSHPKSERIFIASDSNSGQAPTVPPTLTQLPGFSHASTLIPTYPFMNADTNTNTDGIGSSSSSKGGGRRSGVGVPEEVFCDLQQGSPTALSLPLMSGPQTIGILLVWGADIKLDQNVQVPLDKSIDSKQSSPIVSMWTAEDKKQISRVGESLSLALEMDSERFHNRIQTENLRVAMADNLHQIKNPVQALRTFSKLLQRNLAMGGGVDGNLDSLDRLADDISTQSERVVDLLRPFDSILNSMDSTNLSLGSGSSESNMSDGLNPYQRLLKPMERTELVLANGSKNVDDKSMQTNHFLGSLSKVEKDERAMHNIARTKTKSNAKEERLDLEMSFIPDVLQSIFSPSQAISADMGIDMQIIGAGEDAELPGVSAHPKMLQEAVINVLDNAIKYVSYGENGRRGMNNSNPTIRVTLKPNGDEAPPGVTILVEDNGPGIQSEDEEIIFQRGYRGEYTKSFTKGSGIGLDISRELVGKMGGSLNLLNADDRPSTYLRGTVMRFILYRKPNL